MTHCEKGESVSDADRQLPTVLLACAMMFHFSGSEITFYEMSVRLLYCLQQQQQMENWYVGLRAGYVGYSGLLVR